MKKRNARPAKRRRTTKGPSGFAEEAPAYVPAAAAARTQQVVELGAGGRLVIPAPMRQALGMKVGDRLTVRVDGGQLRIYTFKEGLRQARDILSKYLPAGVDPVEDFLKWKREEVALEEAKYDKWSRGE